MNHLHLLRRRLCILLASAAFALFPSANANAASLTLVPDGWSSSAQVTINWSVTSLASGAWIGVYAVGSPDNASYLTSKSISGTSGVVSFGLLANGSYEARLFGDGFYSQKLATVAFTVVTPAGSISLSSSAVKVRESTSVTWSSQPGITSDGWVGIYPPGANEFGFLADIPIQYVAAGTGGKLTFTAPNTAGSYEFRLFADYGYTVKIATASFTVAELVGSMVPGKSGYSGGETVTLAWTADAALPDGAWIGIYPSGTDNKFGFVTYKTVTAGSSGSVAFAGLASGSYEARLFRDATYDRKIGSASFSIGVATTTTSSTTSTTTTSTTTTSTTTTTLADRQAPTVPTGLTATAAGSSQIDLTWTSSIDDVGVTAYKVYRNGTQVETRTVTTWSNTGLSPSTDYSFTVAACDAAGNCSAQSSSTSATTAQSTTSTTTAKSDCLFNWAESAYAALFAPKGTLSIAFGPYYLRFYSATNAYLAVSGSSFVYLGPLSGNQLLDLGPVSTWYANAGCS